MSAALCLGVLVVGCGKGVNPPLRITFNAWPGYEFLYLAQQKGIFAAEGVDVKLIELDSLSDVLRTFERGQADGMASTLIELLLARGESSRSPQVALVTDYSAGGDVVLARPPIDAPAGLRGKRVAAEVGSLNIFVLSRALDFAGLTLDDVTVVPMGQNSMETAFDLGEVDAIVAYPPVAVNVPRKGNVNRVFSSAQIPGEVVDIVALDASVLATRGEDAVRIQRAWKRALQYAETNPEEAYGLMARREGLSPEEFRAALSGGVRLVPLADQPPFFAPDGTLDRTIKVVDQTLRRTGQLHGPDRTADCVFRVTSAAASGP